MLRRARVVACRGRGARERDRLLLVARATRTATPRCSSSTSRSRALTEIDPNVRGPPRCVPAARGFVGDGSKSCSSPDSRGGACACVDAWTCDLATGAAARRAAVGDVEARMHGRRRTTREVVLPCARRRAQLLRRARRRRRGPPAIVAVARRRVDALACPAANRRSTRRRTRGSPRRSRRLEARVGPSMQSGTRPEGREHGHVRSRTTFPGAASARARRVLDFRRPAGSSSYPTFDGRASRPGSTSRRARAEEPAVRPLDPRRARRAQERPGSHPSARTSSRSASACSRPTCGEHGLRPPFRDLDDGREAHGLGQRREGRGRLARRRRATPTRSGSRRHGRLLRRVHGPGAPDGVPRHVRGRRRRRRHRELRDVPRAARPPTGARYREAEYGPLSDRELLRSISPIHKVDRITARRC